jgi:hypothetical protein
MKNDTVNPDKSYTVVSSSYSVKGLVECVNAMIDRGWKPIGGVAVVMELGREGISFFQAMENYEQRTTD